MSLYRANYEIKDFKIIRFVKSDYLGELYIAKDQILDSKVFIRVFSDKSLTEELSLSLMEEAKKQVKLHHESVLTLNSMIIYDERICLIFSYSDGEFLSDVLKDYNKFSQKKALGIIKDICQALHDAHMHGLINGNLTPDDIIIDTNKKVKIMNFHWRELLVPYMKNEILNDFYLYRAPELFKQKNQPVIKSDLYSLGLIMHQILFGKLPYDKGNNLVELYENVKKPQFSKAENHTHEIATMLQKLLAYDPAERYNQPFNLITILNNFLFMREELFDTHKAENIEIPTKKWHMETKQSVEKQVEDKATDKPVLNTKEQDQKAVVELVEVKNDKSEPNILKDDSVKNKLEIAFYKNKYMELSAGYKRVITLAGLAFVLMVLLLVFFPDTIGAWLLGQY